MRIRTSQSPQKEKEPFGRQGSHAWDRAFQCKEGSGEIYMGDGYQGKEKMSSV